MRLKKISPIILISSIFMCCPALGMDLPETSTGLSKNVLGCVKAEGLQVALATCRGFEAAVNSWVSEWDDAHVQLTKKYVELYPNGAKDCPSEQIQLLNEFTRFNATGYLLRSSKTIIRSVIESLDMDFDGSNVYLNDRLVERASSFAILATQDHKEFKKEFEYLTQYMEALSKQQVKN